MNTLERAKYRGKRVDNGEWAYGVPKSCGHGLVKTGIMYNSDDECLRNVIVDPKTVGQFTGLTDKNGVEHFEGNLYKGFDGVYALEWSNDDGMYWLSNVHRVSGGQATAGLLENFELIGNVHDNPELLEVVK